jgi:RNA polymerase sigma factor (sigma-70 family)
MSQESLDRWIGRLNVGDAEAVEHIFAAYEPYLRIVVRRRLRRKLRAKVDSADVVQSVFADVLRGVRAGGWRFSGRAQLMGLLRRIAGRRVADLYRRHGPALDRERPLDEASSRCVPPSALPRPSQVAQGREFWARVLRACPPAHQEVVRLRMEGLPMAEIASRSGLHEGSVRRILYDLARRLSIARRPAVSPPAPASE